MLVSSPKDCVGDVLTVVNSPCSFLRGVEGGCKLTPCPSSLPNGTAIPSPARGARRWGLPEVRGLPRLGWQRMEGHPMGQGTQHGTGKPFSTLRTGGRWVFSKDLLKRIRRTFYLSLETWCLQKLHAAVGTLGQITCSFQVNLLAAFLATAHSSTD